MSASAELVERATEWYCRGFRRASELAKLLGEDPRKCERVILPAVLERLARAKSPEERAAAAGDALERHIQLLKYSWNELARAGKPSVKAQWAQVVMNSNREIDKISGLAGRDIDQQVVLAAVNGFIEGVVRVVEATNDPVLMHRLEGLLSTFLRARDVPLPEPPNSNEPEIIVEQGTATYPTHL